MRNPAQILPDHAAILATLSRSTPVGAGQVAPGSVVRVTGEARPGPDGLLTAPISGRPCVWWRTITVRDESMAARLLVTQRPFVQPPTISRVVASDMGWQFGGGVSTESPAPFAVGDATGEVLLDPRWADVNTGMVSVDDVVGDGFGDPYTVRREWILTPGAPVFACGGVSQDGGRPVLRASEHDALVASTYGEALVVQRARSVLRALPSAASASQRRLLLGAVIGAVVAVAVVVVVLLAVL